MSALPTPQPSAPHGIIAYVSLGRQPFDQRERIEAALAANGLRAVEIVEETCQRGRYGIARVRELACSSAIDVLLVATFNVLFAEPSHVDRFRRDMASRGVRVLAILIK